MADYFEIIREIGIDAGHRVTNHGSKCKNVHGHRYTVQAICRGTLFDAGEQEGMVLDFGFLKDEMMAVIDHPCDHGLILWVNDPLIEVLFPSEQQRAIIKENVQDNGFCLTHCPSHGKIYVLNSVPTAENLARHWYTRLFPRVAYRSEGKGQLDAIKVWETPNCMAAYPVK